MKLIPSLNKWRSWSLPSKLTAISTLLAVISLGVYAIEKSFHMKDWIIDKIIESRYSKLPNITVKIVNPSDKVMSILAEGEFVLWLPQGVNDNAQTIPGRYRIAAVSGSIVKDGLFRIQPTSEVRAVAQLMNPQYFSRILERGDTDLSFIFRVDKGALFFSQTIPFRKDAIDKYCVEAQAGKKD